VRIRNQDVGPAVTYSNAEYQSCDGRSIAWRQESASLKDYLAPRAPDSTLQWSNYCNRARSWQAHVIDFGLYQPELEANPAGGPIVVRSKKLLRGSRTVQATLGTSIGFRYLLDGPQDSAVITVRATHPPLTNPATGKTTQVDEWSQAVSTRRLYWNTGWTFEHGWELVAGKWTIELLHDGKRLQSVSLEVAKAP